MITRVRLACGIALVAMTATACGMGGGAKGDGAQDGGGHVVYAEQFIPMAAWALETDDSFILSRAGCLETLLRYEPDGSLSEMLATSWEQVDPKTWEFQLREGVKFQDGTPVDAEAVSGALTNLLEVKTPARSFNPDVVDSVEAVDASTVRITTTQPDVLLPFRMASPSTGILAPKAYAAKGIDIQGTCTGPFTVVEEVPRQAIRLERNEGYWGEKAQLASAEVRFVIDGASRVTQLQTGEADIAAAVPIAALANLEGDDNVDVQSVELPRTTSMLLNNSRPPFDDPLVRRAIQSAIDTSAIATSIYEGEASPAVGPFSADQPWAPEGASPVTADLDEAERLLDEAGVDPSSLSFDLIAYIDRPELRDLAAVIQEQLRRLGIKVKIRSGEYVSFEPDLLAGDYDAFLLSRGYLVDLGDPAGYLASDFGCDGGYNITHYCDQQTDALITEALQTQDVDARHGIYAGIAEKLQAEAVDVFLVHEAGVMATTARVENFQMHPLNFYVLTSELTLG